LVRGGEGGAVGSCVGVGSALGGVEDGAEEGVALILLADKFCGEKGAVFWVWVVVGLVHVDGARTVAGGAVVAVLVGGEVERGELVGRKVGGGGGVGVALVGVAGIRGIGRVCRGLGLELCAVEAFFETTEHLGCLGQPGGMGVMSSRLPVV
jgi:hypothetical protein